MLSRRMLSAVFANGKPSTSNLNTIARSCKNPTPSMWLMPMYSMAFPKFYRDSPKTQETLPNRQANTDSNNRSLMPHLIRGFQVLPLAPRVMKYSQHRWIGAKGEVLFGSWVVCLSCADYVFAHLDGYSGNHFLTTIGRRAQTLHDSVSNWYRNASKM